MKGLLQYWVTEQAAQRPDAGALAFQGARLSYGELEAASNRMARLLVAAGVQRGDRVCLLCPKSPTAIVALLAVLKADAIYVPLDTTSPAARLARVIAGCDTPWILASGAANTLEQLCHTPGIGTACRVGWLADDPPPAIPAPAFTARDAETYSIEEPASRNDPDAAAHILFTSGSTGQPKGVVITHASVRQFITWAVRYFGTAPTDRISGHPPLHFDLSTFDIFGTFAAGAELHLVPPELNLLPHRMAALIRDAALTQWFSVPSAMNFMAKFDAIGAAGFPALKRVLWCGEVLPVPVLRHWMERVPHASFTNLYGPTETTIASSYYTVPAIPSTDEPIPIGVACEGEELLVLDDRRRPVARGTLGDLYIGGAGLSPGYWRDPEKTDQAFFVRPDGKGPGDRIYRTGDLASIGPDGLVRFAGRRDTQVKTRGHRVELGEIETVLHTVPGLRECAVLGVPSGDFNGVTLCCAFVPAAAGVVTPSTLRSAIGRDLPPYMVPTRWLALKEFPRTASGKIDRNGLKALFENQEPG